MWSTVNFGKYTGKSLSLPQIIFKDPDWFFWAMEENVFASKGNQLKKEADELYRRARSIRIPGNPEKKLVAEYIIHPPTGKFGNMEIVPADRPVHEGASPTFRKPVIDLSVARRISQYDKLGCQLLMSSVKYVLFGNKNQRLTRKRCEDFFDQLSNFVL